MRLLYHRLSRILFPGKVFFLIIFLKASVVNAQFFQPDTIPNQKRIRWVSAMAGGGYAMTMLYLGTVWYAKEDLGPFHFFDDSHEWKQMDKVGHVMGGYQMSRMIIDLYKWAGLPKRRALIVGGASGFLAMSSIEVFDAFGAKWGFSWYDVGANLLGSSLAVLNEGLWNEDRLQLKFSYLPTSYARDPANSRLFGNTFPEWLLKDYNGQVYWLSVNMHSFLPEGNFKRHYPAWINLALGYGAEELVGGYEDPMGDWRTREYRQWYVGLDIDLSRMIPKKGWGNSFLSVLNLFHVPLPAFEKDRTGHRILLFR